MQLEKLMTSQMFIEVGRFGQKPYSLLSRLRIHRFAEYVHLARIGSDQTGDYLDGRRLACAIGPQETKYLALMDIERDVFEHLLTPLPEMVAETAMYFLESYRDLHCIKYSQNSLFVKG